MHKHPLNSLRRPALAAAILAASAACSTSPSSSADTGQGASRDGGGAQDTGGGADGGGLDDSGSPGDLDAGEMPSLVDGGLLLTATVRDFKFHNPIDFENPFFSENDSSKDDRGLVKETLGVDGTPEYAGAANGTLSTSGPESFYYWFHDDVGVNQKTQISLFLAKTQGDIFSYASKAFFPIDNMLFGNETLTVNGNVVEESKQHNYSFTLELHTDFTYYGGESFTFIGDDDIWVFINKKLVIDLGGIHGEEPGTVSLDGQAGTLGLKVGGKYPLDLFFAERHVTGSHFRIDTSLVLQPGPN